MEKRTRPLIGSAKFIIFSTTPPDGIFQSAQKEFFTGVSKNTYFKSFKNFYKKTSAVDYHFGINLQVKTATILS